MYDKNVVVYASAYSCFSYIVILAKLRVIYLVANGTMEITYNI